jgi:cold shock CspA family protein
MTTTQTYTSAGIRLSPVRQNPRSAGIAQMLAASVNQMEEPGRLRATEKEAMQQSVGVIDFFNDTKFFGFIRPADGSKKVFCHGSSLCQVNVNWGGHLSLSPTVCPLQAGSEVLFYAVPRRKGPAALVVCLREEWAAAEKFIQRLPEFYVNVRTGYLKSKLDYGSVTYRVRRHGPFRFMSSEVLHATTCSRVREILSSAVFASPYHGQDQEGTELPYESRDLGIWVEAVFPGQEPQKLDFNPFCPSNSARLGEFVLGYAE